jgi:copper(I)-binding protein
LALASSLAGAQTRVTDAWVRGTVPQQAATGLYAQITSTQGGRLVAASSPIAGVVEIHEMAMDGDVMRMRAVPGIALPAGQPVALQPGGYHVMLLALRQALRAGATVPVTLVIEGADGKRETVEVRAQVRTPDGKAPDPMAGHKH